MFGFEVLGKRYVNGSDDLDLQIVVSEVRVAVDCLIRTLLVVIQWYWFAMHVTDFERIQVLHTLLVDLLERVGVRHISQMREMLVVDGGCSNLLGEDLL